MTTPEQHTHEDMQDAPIIPSWVFLAVAALGLLVVVGVLFLESTFTVIGWAGLAITIVALVVWALMFPEEVLRLIKGRSLTYGGLGILVSIFLIVVASLIYSVIKSRNWLYDFGERDIYSLDTQVRDVLEAMSDDPSIPTVELLGFFPFSQAGERDRVEVLLQDMVNTSEGKVAGYTFVDPNLEPLRTETYLGENGSQRLPAIVVTKIDPATGEPSTTDFEVANLPRQLQIINAILSLSVEGDFRAYVLDLEGGLDITDTSDEGADGLVSDLDEWTVESVNPLRLASPNPPVTLNDPTANAEIMILPGGTQVLSAAEIAMLNDYVAGGGDLFILGDINTEDSFTTAQADDFSNFLWDNFGIRLRNDLVIDPKEPLTENGRRYFVNNYGTHPATSGLDASAGDVIVVESPHSVEISETPPANVTVTVLLSTSDEGYAKADVDFTRDLSLDELAFVDGSDLSGEIPLAVAAENTVTGARVVLFGSADLLLNEWRPYGNIESPEFAEGIILWASEAQNFSEIVRELVPEPNQQDAPMSILDSQVRWISFISLFVLPFGMLIIGFLVWWSQRPQRHVN